MSHTTSATKRRMLRYAWETAQNGEGTLRNQLVALELGSQGLTLNATITGSSSSGRQTSLAPSRQGEKTLLENADTWTELIDLFDSVTASQKALIPPGLTDDTTVFNLMMVSPEMLGITSYTPNRMFLSK